MRPCIVVLDLAQQSVDIINMKASRFAINGGEGGEARIGPALLLGRGGSYSRAAGFPGASNAEKALGGELVQGRSPGECIWTLAERWEKPRVAIGAEPAVGPLLSLVT